MRCGGSGSSLQLLITGHGELTSPPASQAGRQAGVHMIRPWLMAVIDCRALARPATAEVCGPHTEIPCNCHDSSDPHLPGVRHMLESKVK